ncbi:MAG TPA: hypothetical protein VFP29_12850 [Methyloceanibacter sp.]|jgi:hypothetical protein|nr:hypothetical protein [Methyloceanibacter sp.]
MLEVYRDERTAPPQERALALKPKLRSWTGRVWRWHPDAFQLMLKLDASVAVPDVEHDGLRAALTPFAAELMSFALYLDYTDEGKLPFPWAVGAFNVERGKGAFMRFYDFLKTPPAQVLVPLLPAAGAQSDLILSIVPYRLETNLLVFLITEYDLGFHNRIG